MDEIEKKKLSNSETNADQTKAQWPSWENFPNSMFKSSVHTYVWPTCLNYTPCLIWTDI